MMTDIQPTERTRELVRKIIENEREGEELSRRQRKLDARQARTGNRYQSLRVKLAHHLRAELGMEPKLGDPTLIIEGLAIGLEYDVIGDPTDVQRLYIKRVVNA